MYVCICFCFFKLLKKIKCYSSLSYFLGISQILIHLLLGSATSMVALVDTVGLYSLIQRSNSSANLLSIQPKLDIPFGLSDSALKARFYSARLLATANRK